MKKTFTSRHFECSDALKEHCLTSVDKLLTFYDRIIGIDIILEPTQNAAKPQQAELLVQIPGELLTVREQSQTYELAMHEAVNVMSRQIKKYKSKHFDH